MLTRELSPPEIKAPNTKIVKTCFRPDAKYLVRNLLMMTQRIQIWFSTSSRLKVMTAHKLSKSWPRWKVWWQCTTRLLSDLLSHHISRHDTTRKVVVTLSNPRRGPEDRVYWGQSLPLNVVAGHPAGWWHISCHDYHVHRRGCTRVLGSKFAIKYSCRASSWLMTAWW